MITIITNISGGRMPISHPMFNAINSVSPRVFINVPMTKLSRYLPPVSLTAAGHHPPGLPAVANKMKTTHTPHNSGVLINPILVRSPVKAKRGV